MSDYAFSDGHGSSRVLRDWWAGLADNKGDRAELRRCETVSDVVATPAYHLIYRRLVKAGLPDDELAGSRSGRVPVIVSLLAQLRNEPAHRMSLAQAMSAATKDSDRPKVSQNRFRALLQLDTPDQLLPGFRRVLPLIKDDVRPVELAHDLYYWGEAVKRRWAYAYDWPERKSD